MSENINELVLLDNKLRVLPPEIENLTKLTKLYIHENPFRVP